MAERELNIQQFRQISAETGASLANSIQAAEAAMEQTKKDHHRATMETSDLAAEEALIQTRLESLASQKQATAELEHAMKSMREGFAQDRQRVRGLRDDNLEMHDWFLMPAARVVPS